jgi:hypothetical protein
VAISDPVDFRVADSLADREAILISRAADPVVAAVAPVDLVAVVADPADLREDLAVAAVVVAIEAVAADAAAQAADEVDAATLLEIAMGIRRLSGIERAASRIASTHKSSIRSAIRP